MNTCTFAARDFWPGRGARCFRTGTRAYPSGVCKERATTSGPKGTAARRVASLFGSGFVAPLPAGRQVGHSPASGDAPSSRLARTEKRRNKRGRIYETGYLVHRESLETLLDCG